MELYYATELSWVFRYAMDRLITVDRSKYQTLHEAMAKARMESFED